MAYKQLWGTPSPGHIVYLIDLSGSMEGKIDYTINAMYSVLRTLVIRCVKGNTVAARLSCTVIGYNSTAKIIWDDMPILEIAKKVTNCKKYDIPIFDKNTEFKPERQTWMRLAFDEAKKDIDKWIAKQKAAKMIMPAPIVINITDGYPYEGDKKTWSQVFQETLQSAQALMKISTSDGNVRLFNIHHDPDSKSGESIFPHLLPSRPEEQFLFNASSEMDDDSIKTAADLFGTIKGARCMVSNVKDPSLLISLIEFGSTQQITDGTDGSYF